MDKVHEVIEKRWSPRAFQEKEIEADKLIRIFQAAGRAPSSNNEQPWRFIVGEKGKPGAYSGLFASLNEYNQKWAFRAPVLAVIVAKKDFTLSGKPNQHHLYDCGQAAAFLSIQATSESLYVHQMAGFFPDKVKDTFQIPDAYEVITALVIGYLGNPDILAEDYKKNEYQKVIRKDIKEIVFTSWEVPLMF